MVRHRLSVVAGGGSYQASTPLFSGQRQKFVQRSAFFERPRPLQVFEFEKDWAARYARQFMRLRCR
jgi:hypothetical protein